MVVRPEARASYLAYAYLRGKSLDTIERPNSSSPDWANVKRIAKKFSGVTIFDEADFDAWAGIDKSLKKVA